MNVKFLWYCPDPSCEFGTDTASKKCPSHKKNLISVVGKYGQSTEELEEEDLKHIEICKKFEDPELFFHIHKELSKEHLCDDIEKMFVFMMTITAFLPDPSDHKSICLKGDSSVGKDNLINTVFSFMPDDSYLMLTRATQATLEEDIGGYNIIGYSEMNAYRENGANSELVEVIKQMTEGGTHAMKKDLQRNVKMIKQDQKTVLYGTTDGGIDDEIDTRFVIVNIGATKTKVSKINFNTLINVANPKEDHLDGVNWLKEGLSGILKPYPVIFPCLNNITDTTPFFDASNPRSQRDVKRLVSLAKSFAWIHQMQRKIKTINGIDYIMGHPQDFINALILCSPFFNSTYKGFEMRIEEMYQYMKKKEVWVSRKEIMMDLKIKRTTFYERMGVMKEFGVVDEQGESGKEMMYKVDPDVYRTSPELVHNLSALWKQISNCPNYLRMGYGRVADGYETEREIEIEDLVVSVFLREHVQSSYNLSSSMEKPLKKTCLREKTDGSEKQLQLEKDVGLSKVLKRGNDKSEEE